MADKQLVAPNVSSVPQYSPFRYPGGKSRLYPFISKWLSSKAAKPDILVEPFAGGAHVGLAAAIEGMVRRVLLVEIDENIAAVWETILSKDHQWLEGQIAAFKISEGTAEYAVEREKDSTKEQAFKVILQNRISRSGITAPGSGVLNQGENGKGLRSRWYPDTLVERIRAISSVRHKIDFIHGDGLAVIQQKARLKDATFFIDPPYPRAGRRLYKYSDVDPRDVFRRASYIKGDFLITYDDADEILELVNDYELKAERILMSTSHHRERYELLISRDLSSL